MFELSRAVTVNASPQAVWRVLTDFPGYRAWTKAILVDGAPEVGGAMNYQIGGRMKSGVRRAIRYEGKVRVATADQELIWTSGIPGVLGLRFGFGLRPSEGATDVWHTLQVSGVAALLLPRRLTRLYEPILRIVTLDLARHMSKTRLSALRTTPDIRRRKRQR